MTNHEIDQFITEIKRIKENNVRIKGDKKYPTKELNFKYSGVSHAPTMEVEQGKRTDIYEFEKCFSASNLNHQIAKWILFSIRAKKLSGQFYLVVNEKDQLKFTKIIREKLLDIKIITLTS